MNKTVIELFAGVGGFRVGLNNVQHFDNNGRAIENRDWNFVWANQWEPSTKVQDAYNCYTTRFGDSPNHSNEDIATVDKNLIPNHSLLVGGFPCQDYSVARTKAGEKGIEGKKGVLFWEIAKILEVKNTPFVLLENVDRLLKSPAIQRGRDFGIMLRTFYDLGYNVEWRVLNAADYSCAQKRRRVFIFAWKNSLQYNRFTENADLNIVLRNGLFAQVFPVTYDVTRKTHHIDITSFIDTVDMTERFNASFENNGVMVNGIIRTEKALPIIEPPITLRMIRESRSNLNAYFLNPNQEAKFTYLKGSKKIKREKPNGEIYHYTEGTMSFPDNLDMPGRTMLTSEASSNRSTHIINDYETDNLRFITPIEAERLQSFPDDWTNTGMSERKRYFMMGNALVTKLINRLEKKISIIIENEPADE